MKYFNELLISTAFFYGKKTVIFYLQEAGYQYNYDISYFFSVVA